MRTLSNRELRAVVEGVLDESDITEPAVADMTDAELKRERRDLRRQARGFRGDPLGAEFIGIEMRLRELEAELERRLAADTARTAPLG